MYVPEWSPTSTTCRLEFTISAEARRTETVLDPSAAGDVHTAARQRAAVSRAVARGNSGQTGATRLLDPRSLVNREPAGLAVRSRPSRRAVLRRRAALVDAKQ